MKAFASNPSFQEFSTVLETYPALWKLVTPKELEQVCEVRVIMDDRMFCKLDEGRVKVRGGDRLDRIVSEIV
jgi:hypothetical protein